MATPWYEGFFHGIALDVWRQAMKPEITKAEADWLERELCLEPGVRLLDVPCGNGRHALELASRGHTLVGMDISEEFLAEARAGAAERALDAEFLHADMRELPEVGTFDGAYCVGNSFGYLDPEGMEAFMAALSSTLRPGARFAIDMGMAAESILPHLQPNRWSRVGDILFLGESRYEVGESRLDTEYTFVRDGRSDTRKASHYVFTVPEIRRMLDRAGLTTQTLHRSLEGDPFELGSPRLLLVAEKRGKDL